jgi:hypothetical protein
MRNTGFINESGNIVDPDFQKKTFSLLSLNNQKLFKVLDNKSNVYGADKYTSREKLDNIISAKSNSSNKLKKLYSNNLNSNFFNKNRSSNKNNNLHKKSFSLPKLDVNAIEVNNGSRINTFITNYRNIQY